MSEAIKHPAKGRHFGMLRELRMADWMTLLNGTTGMAAIFSFLEYCIAGRAAAVWLGAGLLAAALAFDILDGTIARKRHETSDVGRELDSLSDVVSFGVAPAVLGYAVGLRGEGDMVLLSFFVACGISRLARYNVTAVSRSDSSGKVRFYEGLPIPTSLLLGSALLVLFARGLTGSELPWGAWELGSITLHPLALLFLLHGLGMVSRTIRIPKP